MVSFVAVALCAGLHAAASAERVQAQPSARGPRIVVPAVKAVPVVTDGKFSPGEWDGAFRQALGDDFEVYLLADAEYLCVGFKYLKDVEADYLSEVFVATSDKQFINLHSSGSLGEGVNDLPLQSGRTTFTIVAPLGASRAAWWESNAMPRSVAGVQGKEFKISRARLPGRTVRLAGGMGVVNMSMRANAAFPTGHGFSSVEKWAELVLPPAK
jgi:hypothetical protein